jgi:hypothetical protein
LSKVEVEPQPSYEERVQRRVEMLRGRGDGGVGGAPEVIEEYFEAKGKCLTLVWADPRNLAMESTYGRVPVLFEEIPEERIKKQIKQAGFEIINGHIRRGDCILVQQDLEERDAYRVLAQQKKDMLEGTERILAKLEDIERSAANQTGGQHFVKVTPKHIGRVADHIQGGPELLAQARASQASTERSR